MGDIIPFKKPERKTFSNTVLWGEGMFGFNPYFIKSMFIANDVNICFMFHEVADNKEPDGWELMVKCNNEKECKLAYRDLINILKAQYGINLEKNNDN